MLSTKRKTIWLTFFEKRLELPIQPTLSKLLKKGSVDDIAVISTSYLETVYKKSLVNTANTSKWSFGLSKPDSSYIGARRVYSCVRIFGACTWNFTVINRAYVHWILQDAVLAVIEVGVTISNLCSLLFCKLSKDMIYRAQCSFLIVNDV